MSRQVSWRPSRGVIETNTGNPKVSVTNISWAAFAPISLHQKNYKAKL